MLPHLRFTLGSQLWIKLLSASYGDLPDFLYQIIMLQQSKGIGNMSVNHALCARARAVKIRRIQIFVLLGLVQ